MNDRFKSWVTLNDDEIDVLERLSNGSEFWGSLYDQAIEKGELSPKQHQILKEKMASMRERSRG